MTWQRKRENVHQAKTGKKPLPTDNYDISRLSPANNVTARKKTEEALKASQMKYLALTETTSDFIWETDSQGRYTYCSPQMKRLWGYDPQEWIGKTPFDAMLPEEREQGIRGFMDMAQAQRSFTVLEVNSLDSQGCLITVEISGVPYFDTDGKFSGFRGISRDITERKQMERSLREYAQRITQVQEEERKRIAYELHDDTAQYLSILKLQLESLLESGKIRDPEIISKLQYLKQDAARAVDDIRRYSHELRPSVLDQMGLRASLEQIAEDMKKLNQFTIEVNVKGTEPDLTEEVKLGLFRIAQEALNNVRKHAKASKASVMLEFQERYVSMAVIDNGVGFDVKEAPTRSSLKGNLGLMSMKERADLIGANLNIESKPSQGTAIRVEMTL